MFIIYLPLAARLVLNKAWRMSLHFVFLWRYLSSNTSAVDLLFVAGLVFFCAATHTCFDTFTKSNLV